MSLNFSVTPGKVWQTGEKITTAKLNQTAVPGIEAEGTIAPADMAEADYSDKLDPGDYFFTLATLTGTTYGTDTLVNSYADGLLLAVKVNATNPAAVQLDAGPGAKPLYTAGGTRSPDATEIPANSILEVRYSTSLNSGAGGWQILNTLKDRLTIFEFTGASAQAGGQSGLVPAPRAGDQTKVLRGTGQWESLTAEIDAQIAANSANTLPLFLSSNY